MKVTRDNMDRFLQNEIGEIERRAEHYARKLSAAPMCNASEVEIQKWNEAWLMYEHYWDCACFILHHYRAMIEGKKDDKSE